MIKMLLCLFTLLLAACTNRKVQDRNLEIVIKSSESYTYDIAAQTYTVHNWEKPDTTIKFHLAEDDVNAIVDKYYYLRLDQLSEIDKETGNIFIKDECSDMPKLYTVLQIKNGIALQEIQIDNTCENFYFKNYRQANRVRHFIDFILKIIHAKPELSDAPLSDIWYI